METAVLEPEIADADVPADPSLAMVDPAYVNNEAPVTAEEAPSVPRPSNFPPAATDEEVALARDQHYEEIREREIEVREMEANHASAAEHAKALKKEFEAGDKAIRFLIARGPVYPQKFPVRVRAARNLIMPKMAVGDEFDVVEVSHVGAIRIICDADCAPDGDWVKAGEEVYVIE